MTLTDRMIRAARLDGSLYEEVEADTTLTGQATAVVLLSAVAAGIGSLSRGGAGIIGMLIVALIGWYIWAGLTYLIGTRLLPEPETKADFGQLLRTIGFSASPGIIRVVGIIPFLSGLAFLVAGIWQFVAMVIAVQHALDYKSAGRAIGVVLVGAIVQGLAFWLFFGRAMMRY